MYLELRYKAQKRRLPVEPRHELVILVPTNQFFHRHKLTKYDRSQEVNKKKSTLLAPLAGLISLFTPNLFASQEA